ncbi:BamA/TamA family outer membrane protein [Cyclonatronum proteinivorum]|nr:hypothetical protein [Cyclonatronum proteinivorum]
MNNAFARSAPLAATQAPSAPSSTIAAVPDSLSLHPLHLKLDGRRVSLPDSLRKIEPPIITEEAAGLPQNDVLQQAIRYVTEKAGADGYLQAAPDSLRLPESPGDPLQLWISRGCRFSLSSIEARLIPTANPDTADATAVPEQSEAELQALAGRYLRPGRPFRQESVEREIRAQLDFWEREGYLFARVQPELHIQDCTVAVTLKADPGPLVQVESLRLTGVNRNNPVFLARVSGIREGMVLNAASLRAARLNLENTGLLASVGEAVLMQEPGSSGFIVEIDVEERRTNAVDLLFGYLPDPGGGGTVIGTGDLVLRNVFLPGSRLDLQFERLQQFVTRLDLGFESQHIGSTPFGAGARFRFEQQDTLYQVRTLRLNGRYRLSSTTSLIASLRQEVSVSGALPVAQLRVLDATSLFTGFGITFRDTDRLRNPTRGAELSFLAETGIKRITDANREQFTERSRLNQQELSFSARAYLSPLRRQVISPGLNGFLSLSPEYTESDLNRFGGARSLRGYREEHFQASRMIWGDAEYRYLLDETSYAFVFGALGWYERPALIFEGRPTIAPEDPRPPASQREWLRSWGFGFAVGTPLGTMQFSYALGRGDSFGNGKVHVGLRADI